jgi:hypothetical protein
MSFGSHMTRSLSDGVVKQRDCWMSASALPIMKPMGATFLRSAFVVIWAAVESGALSRAVRVSHSGVSHNNVNS